MRLNKWRKYAPHLIILATLIAIIVPTLGSYALNELNPYLALSEETAKPEAIVADRMEIVDRTYVDDDPAKGWETVTWVFKLQVNNRGDVDMILPAANVTLNYLDDTLGKGWISHKYEIKAGKSKMVNLYMVMENERITYTWWYALSHGRPLDLKAVFEPYILIDDPNDEPLLGLNMIQELEFSFPHSSRGPPPFIHSITRSPVKANQPVTVSVSATDKGTGISNRTYIYYSINNGITWNQIVMTGGEWWNSYKLYYYDTEYDPSIIPHGLLGDYYPIRSTLQAETYEGEIPGLPTGTNVLFKVYLEDYAGNVDHIKTANWVESQTYSYIVPSAGAISEFTQKFKQNTEPSSTDKLFDYLSLNGIHISNFMYLSGVDADFILDNLIETAKFLYENDIDANYALGMILIDEDKAYKIMDDSGIPPGYLMDLYGISTNDFFDYMVEHIFLPTKHDLVQQARYKFDEINEMVMIDEIETTPNVDWVPAYQGPIVFPPPGSCKMTNWWLWGNGNINGDKVGEGALWWTPKVPGPSSIGRNFSSNPFDLSGMDKLVFYLDYGSHASLNGNLLVTLTDNNGNNMTSYPFTFENKPIPGGLQEIALSLNSQKFQIDSGFNFGAIHQVNFTYIGVDPLAFIILDYICAYSSRGYNTHRYFTYDAGLNLRIRQLDKFLFGEAYWTPGEIYGKYPGEFSGIGAASGDTEDLDLIIKDWSVNMLRTSSWNFLSLMATDNGTEVSELNKLGELGELNYHMIAANLILENRNIPNFYEKLCEILDTEIDEFEEKPVKREDIYPYTQTLAASMVYIPFGGIIALATVLKVRRYRIRKKIQKLRTKYTKIGKR